MESGLENWVKTSLTTNKVNSIDKNKKVDWINPKKIVSDRVRGSQFLYISYKFDYKVGSWLLQYFSLDFSDPHSMVGLFHYIVIFKRSWPYICWSSQPLLECLSHRTPPQAPLCARAANIAMFRGFFHSNVARKLGTEPLMWW